MWTSWRMRVMLIAILWMQWIAVLVFMYGFFPIKSSVEGIANAVDDIPQGIRSEWEKRKVGQVVLVVIDALRADFVLPQNLLSKAGIPVDKDRPKIRYLHDLLVSKEQNSIAFVARANTPTVTLPRIKALMSGTIPGFADVVLNFGSKRLEGDNLMEQWKRSGRNMTMYGDDTWIKLFPEHFMRHDGTTSFFVSDYTEVDQNVTRHLTDEVHRDDWDVSVLHYLGLDHIGHLDGPDGSAVPEKLDEMGQIVKFLRDEIVLKKDKWKRGLPPLLVVLGDHGMADAGGHGGASVSEVMTPMIFLTHPDLDLGSPRFKEIKQTDLVPTLAWLTGVPIPRNNIGTMIFNDKNDDAVFYNALQVSRYVKDTELESMLKNATFYGSKVIVVLEQMIASVEENLTDYNMSALLIGIALIYLSIVVTYWYSSNGGGGGLTPISSLRYLHILSLASTSFIEEEHQTMYFIATTLIIAYKLLDKSRSTLKCLTVLFLFRTARTFNQTGDKWSHLPDFGDWLKKADNAWAHLLVHGLGVVGLIIIGISRSKTKLGSILAVISYLLVFVQKTSDSGLVSFFGHRNVCPARIVYSVSLLRIGLAVVTGFLYPDAGSSVSEQLFMGALPILGLLTNTHNTILLTLHILFEAWIFRDGDPPPNNQRQQRLGHDSLIDSYSIFGYALFFQLGNSNGLATVDVGSAYIGITSFNPWIVGTLLAVSTFSGPILWMLLFACKYESLILEEATSMSSFRSNYASFLLSRGFEITLYLCISTLHRHHLFVWTVFSPKLLYLAMAVLTANIMHSLIIIIICQKRAKIYKSEI